MRLKRSDILTVAGLVLALFPTLAVPHLLKGSDDSLSISNSILALLLFAGAFMLIKKGLTVLNRRLAVVSGCLGAVFSAFTVFGVHSYRYRCTLIDQASSWAAILALWPLFCAAIALLFHCLPKLTDVGASLSQKFPRVRRLHGAALFCLVWALMMLAWLPSFLATYPGVYGYDSVFQVNYYRSEVYDLHHPLLHTLLLGFCVVTLGDLLGSAEAGMCVYSVFQMLLLSGALSAVYCLYIQKRLRFCLRLPVLLLFLFFPLNAILGFSSTKDTIFSLLFALTLMLLLLIAEDPARLKKWYFFGAVVLCVVAMCAFRNQGIYVFVFGMVFAFLFLKRHWKSLLALFLSVLVAFSLFSGPITTWIGGVGNGSVKEMMSVPCVQLSRAMLYNAEELTPEEKELIEQYIPRYTVYESSAGISDSMKNFFPSDRFKQDPAEFIRLWAGVFVKCPLTYIDAWARLTIGLWYPDMNYRDDEAYHPYWEYYASDMGEEYFNPETFLLVEQTPVKGFERLYEFYYELTYDSTYQEIPLVSLLFSSGFSFWLVLLFTAYCIYKKQYRFLFPAAFLIGFWLTLMLGPVVLFRYVYPLFLAVPMLFAASINFEKERVMENG